MFYTILFAIGVGYCIYKENKNTLSRNTITKIFSYQDKKDILIPTIIFVFLSAFLTILYLFSNATSEVSSIPALKYDSAMDFIFNYGILWKVLWIINAIHIGHRIVYNRTRIIKWIISFGISILLICFMNYTSYCFTSKYLGISEINSIIHTSAYTITQEETIGIEQIAYYILIYGFEIVTFLKEKRGYQDLPKVGFILTAIASPLICFWLCEMNAVSVNNELAVKYVIISFITAVIIELVFIFLPIKSYMGLLLYNSLFWIFGVINHYVTLFRGTPLTASDLFILSTAENVADQYTIVPNDTAFYSFLILLVMETIILSFRGYDFGRANKKIFYSRKTIGLIVSLVLFINWFWYSDWETQYGISLQWKPTDSSNLFGFFNSFIESGKELQTTEPNGYSKQDVENILAMQDDDSEIENINQKPVIIGIMNESFSNLGVLGPLEYVDDDLTFFHSLKDDPNTIEFGYDYVSVYGGNTANTEFEALTGDSLSFVSTIPYVSYDFSNISTYSSILKNEGYTTTAIHPSDANNYRRSTVYEEMEFDDFLSIEDPEFTGKDTYRDWVVSDQDDYDELIKIFENSPSSEQYIFNVTMQNHSAYDLTALSNSNVDIVNIDPKYDSYTDYQCYQSILQDSDEALEKLITYFRNVDQPVLIYFFGDHQPSLNPEFVDSVMAEGKTEEESALDYSQKLYKVPYFIWANFETNELPINTYSEDGYDITSPLYLSASVAAYSGQG